MSDDKPGPITIQVEPELLAQLVEDAERIVEGATSIALAARALTATAPNQVATRDTVAAAAVEAVPAAVPVWDLRLAALENYDAESLVALRKDHTADGHVGADCPVCKVVDRRLGLIDPT